MTTNIGDVGKVGAIASFDDPQSKPIPELRGLLNLFAPDLEALAAAALLRNKCPGILHTIGKPGEDLAPEE